MSEGMSDCAFFSDKGACDLMLKITTTLFFCSTTTFYAGNGDLLLTKYRPVCHDRPIWLYNQSGATELLIMRDFHYGRMSFKSVIITLRAVHS